jgi:endonuclease YncB( thermonuclease family)
MPAPRYRLIRGEFYVLYPDLPRNGPEPDGDTISFLPDDDGLVQALPRFGDTPADRKHLGVYSVRFEGIDALETHFQNHHQNLAFADAARDLMLREAGFTAVEFFDDRPNKVQSATPHPLPGYILATGIEQNGRIVAQVYAGEPDAGLVDGGRVFVDEAMLDRSVNAMLVRAGLAYGEFYTTMPFPLITHMRDLVTQARAAGAGFWPHEDVGVGTPAQPTGVVKLSDLVIFPKLYRRLADYFGDGHTDLAAFDTWVRAVPERDDPAQLPTGEHGHLHDLYQVDEGGISLRILPEQVVFLE